MGGPETDPAPLEIREPREHLALEGLFLLDGCRGVHAAYSPDIRKEPARPGKPDRERVHEGRAKPPLEVLADRPERRLAEDVDGGRTEAPDIPGRDPPHEPEVDPDTEPGKEAYDLRGVLVDAVLQVLLADKVRREGSLPRGLCKQGGGRKSVSDAGLKDPAEEPCGRHGDHRNPPCLCRDRRGVVPYRLDDAGREDEDGRGGRGERECPRYAALQGLFPAEYDILLRKAGGEEAGDFEAVV